MPTEIGPHNLTSNTSNPPYVASANGYPEDAWMAFDGNSATFYQSDPDGGSYNPEYPGAWIQLDTGSGGLLNSYAITCGPDPTTAPLIFTLMGSPDGVALTVIDTEDAQSGWAAGETRTYNLPAPVSFRYFVLFIAAVNGATGDSSVVIGELYLYGVLLTPQTIAFPPIAAHDATDAPFALAATASSGLPISWEIVGPATITGSTVTLLGTAGSVTVTALQVGNSTYAAATPVEQTFAVTTGTPTTFAVAYWPSAAWNSAPITGVLVIPLTASSPFTVTASGAPSWLTIGDQYNLKGTSYYLGFGVNLTGGSGQAATTFTVDVVDSLGNTGSVVVSTDGANAGQNPPGVPGEIAVTPSGVTITFPLTDEFLAAIWLYSFPGKPALGTTGAILDRSSIALQSLNSNWSGPYSYNSTSSVISVTPSVLPGYTGTGELADIEISFTVNGGFDTSFGSISFIIYDSPPTPQYNLLVFDEGPEPERQAFVQPHAGRWFYHRNIVSPLGFFGFFFDGVNMVGLTGAIGGAAAGFSLADFRSFQTADPGGLAIECVYQSHYEDAGEPDNDKMWLDIAIDAELGLGAIADVYVAFNNGTVPPLLIGSLPIGPRKTTAFPFQVLLFPLAGDGGYLARNISIIVDIVGMTESILHNVYLYYYVEARLAATASTIPTDLGVGKNKQCKELQLDIDTTAGEMAGAVVSDLPGNALTIRANVDIGQGGRRSVNFPFPVTEGFLWQVVLTTGGGVYFRLYAVRLLMRVLGVYVQAYESEEGFVWDSMQVDLGDADVKFIDQLQIEIDTDPGAGTVSVTILTELPGEAFVSRGTSPYLLVTQTAGPTARHWVTVPLPDQGIWGRSIDVQTTGTVGYRIYTVRAHWRKIGRYLCGSTPSGFNDAMNVLEFDFKSERINVFKRLEIDCWAYGVVTVQVLTDQNGGAAPAVVYTTTLTTAGRQAIVFPLPPGLRGRLLRIRLTSPAAAFLFAIRVWTRAVDVLADDTRGIWSWQPFPLEESDALPQWTNLLIDETSPLWKWVDVDFTVKDG